LKGKIKRNFEVGITGLKFGYKILFESILPKNKFCVLSFEDWIRILSFSEGS